MDLPNIITEPYKHYAVMVLYEQATQSLILTKRSNNLSNQPGEICFPGGKWEPQDKDYYATALRELDEELGINSMRVTLIKELSSEISVSNRMIHPWLATIECIEPYMMNPDEVSTIVLVPMHLVKNIENYTDCFVERYGLSFKSCQFFYPHEFIWGVTARIMKQLCE